MYNKIKNPITGHFVNTNSKLGKSIIQNYINSVGGAQPRRDLSAARERRRLAALTKMESSSPKIQAVKPRRDLSAARERRRLAALTKIEPQPVKHILSEDVELEDGYIWGVGLNGPVPLYVGNNEPVYRPKPIVKAKAKPIVKDKAKPVLGKSTLKEKEKEGRLKASYYYDTYGKDKTVGDRCDIRKDGNYNCLLKRKNNVAYWAKPTKAGTGQESCGNWTSRCKDPKYV